jgi:hypothetical protein
MATLDNTARANMARTTQAGQVEGGLGFDWLFTVLSTLLVGGVFLDGWAHNHGKVDQSFFTPWHAMLYSAYVLVAVFLAWTLLSNHLKGYAWRQAVPAGYEASVLGAIIFGLGGVGDLAWHTVFGIEKGIEGLISPTHLMLALGATLMASGPLRAAWQRRNGRNPGWGALAPAVLVLTYIMSLLMFFTQYAHPVVKSRVDQGGDSLGEMLGVVSILLQSAIMMGIVLLAIRRWRLPVGALALMFALNGLLVDVLAGDLRLLTVGSLYALLGLVADLLNLVLAPSVERPGAVRLFAFAVPFFVYGVYFMAILALGGEIDWSVHVWTGAIFLSGIVGLLLSYLLVPPRLPAGQEQ